MEMHVNARSEALARLSKGVCTQWLRLLFLDFKLSTVKRRLCMT